MYHEILQCIAKHNKALVSTMKQKENCKKGIRNSDNSITEHFERSCKAFTSNGMCSEILSKELEIYLFGYGSWAKWPEDATGMRIEGG